MFFVVCNDGDIEIVLKFDLVKVKHLMKFRFQLAQA